MNKKPVLINSWLLLLIGLVLALVWTLLVSCSTQDSSVPAFLEVKLTDAPGEYQQVNIDIQDVQVKSDGDSSSTGWKSINLKKGVYDLMKLTNGLDTLLGDAQLPAGKISQIRLILGSNNTVKAGGVVYSLKTPSAQQSGLKIQVHSTLLSGVTYKILLDFDAGRSIVSAGNSGMHILKPVIRATVEAESGAIKGLVSPVASRPAIYALMGTDTIATTMADTVSGKFLFNGLAAGSYNVSFNPKTGYLPLIKQSVMVSTGNVTDLGTVTILQ